MDMLFVLGCLVVVVLLFSFYRLQRIRRRTVRFHDGSIDYSDEYIKTMNERVEAMRISRNDAS